jgi:hypothetical protein
MSRRVSEANDRLTQALIRAAARGVRPRWGDYETAHLFLSEDPHERRIATAMCTGCVVWLECDEVGKHQKFGVWASTDRTRHQARRQHHDQFLTMISDFDRPVRVCVLAATRSSSGHTFQLADTSGTGSD